MEVLTPTDARALKRRYGLQGTSVNAVMVETVSLARLFACEDLVNHFIEWQKENSLIFIRAMLH